MLAVETFSDLAFGDIFLHLLTGNLALLADEFALEDFCSSLFDGFLLTASPRCPSSRSTSRSGALGTAGEGVGGRLCSRLQPSAASSRKENVQRHVLRLLLHLHHRVAPSKLEALQKALEPTGQVGALPCPAPPQAGWHACACVCERETDRKGEGEEERREICVHTLWACPEATRFPPQSGEAVKELYSQLGEKLEQLDRRKPSPAQATETPALELPLPSVPAPAVL